MSKRDENKTGKIATEVPPDIDIDNLSMETPEDATRLTATVGFGIHEPSVMDSEAVEDANCKKEATTSAEGLVDDLAPLQDKLAVLLSDPIQGDDKTKKDLVTNDEDEEVAEISENAMIASDPDTEESKDDKRGRKKSSAPFFSKVAFRSLPPTLDKDEFLRIIIPDPEDYNYFAYVPAKKEFGREATSAAFLNFPEAGVADAFIERFNGYIIVDQHGAEYPMVVDYAIFQGIPKSCKPDPLAGTFMNSEAWKEFMVMYNESPDGVIGVKPQFTDAKAMAEHVLKELEEKEENKGKLQSTPLLDSLREKMKAERDKKTKEREDQTRRRKERDRQRVLRKEARKEKQEQQRRERKEKERREREQRDKERRDRNRKLEGGGNGNKTEKSSASVKDNATQAQKAQPANRKVECGDNPGTKPKAETSADRDVHEKASSSSKSHQGPKNYEQKQDNYKEKDYVPRRSYNDRRNRSDRERDRQSKNSNDQGPTKKSIPGTSGTKIVESIPNEKSAVKDDVDNSTKSVISGATSDGKTKSKEDSAGKPKTKVVKKVVKIIRVKSSDGVPTEGRVVVKQPPKAPSVEIPSTSTSTNKTEQPASKQEVGTSRAPDRARRGRPDMQIYRPGSLRQSNSGAGNAKSSGNSKDKNGASKIDDSTKTKDAKE